MKGRDNGRGKITLWGKEKLHVERRTEEEELNTTDPN